jgi:biopolymer transport protein ExbD
VVAGPNGEALVATGVGIAVGLPAVLACNFFLRRLKITNADPDELGADLISISRKPIAVSVDAKGLVYLDREQVELPRLEPRLHALKDAQPESVVHLSSDEVVNYGSVANVMALIEHAENTRVAVLTNTQ